MCTHMMCLAIYLSKYLLCKKIHFILMFYDFSVLSRWLRSQWEDGTPHCRGNRWRLVGQHTFSTHHRGPVHYYSQVWTCTHIHPTHISDIQYCDIQNDNIIFTGNRITADVFSQNDFWKVKKFIIFLSVLTIQTYSHSTNGFRRHQAFLPAYYNPEHVMTDALSCWKGVRQTEHKVP